MDRKKSWLAGVAAAVMMSAGTVLLTAGPAAAATCDAPGSQSCVAVSYQTSHVKSIRVDGRCLIGASGKYSSVRVDRWTRPDVQTYGGTRCEGGTHNSATVRWGSQDSERFRWVSIS